MRSIWKGSVAFGLVNVPVKVYSATGDHDLKFHQVHARTTAASSTGGVQRMWWLSSTATSPGLRGRRRPDGGHHRRGHRHAARGRSHEIEVLEFVPAGDLDPIMFDRSYYLEPNGKSPKSYLLCQAGRDRPRGHRALRVAQQDAAGALRVKDFSSARSWWCTLLWPDEIRDPDFPSLDTDVEVRPAELKMAGQVVESMSDDFHPEQYTDTYQEQLQELVDAKLSGGEAFATEDKPARLDETEGRLGPAGQIEASVRRRREESAARQQAAAEEPEPAEKAPARKTTAKAPARKAAPRKAPAKKKWGRVPIDGMTC